MSIFSPTKIEASSLPDPVPIIEEIKRDEVACNCWLYIKNKIASWPNTKDIVANSIYPTVGGVTILNYDGILHYVWNREVTEAGIWIKESNFYNCEYSTRFLTWDYLKDHQALYWHVPEVT